MTLLNETWYVDNTDDAAIERALLIAGAPGMARDLPCDMHDDIVAALYYAGIK